MRILVVGATGEIGRSVIEAAIAADHQVTALVRSPEKLADIARSVRTVRGDVIEVEQVAAAVAGQEAVVSALGSSPDPTQLDVPAVAMRCILRGMQEAGVSRLIGLAGGAVDVPGERKPLSGRLASALVRLFARNVVEAKQREFAAVAESDVEWTMVRPPRVVPGQPSGHVVIDARLHSMRVSSGDVGVAMLELATGREWLRQAPYVSVSSDRQR